jgi:hypothetical protein
MNRVRGLAVGLMATGLLTITTFGQPAPASAADPDQELTATLDGKPIPLADVSKYNCDDFAYPEIRCWSTKALQDARATLVTLLTSIDYVTIFDFTNFGGASMNVSQDYATLATIGWNDKISSFKGKNNETGTFWTDWFYTGTSFSFCCNTSVGNLNGFSNTFSSIIRT